MLYKEMERMSINELEDVKLKLMTCLIINTEESLENGLKLIYGKYSETTMMNSPLSMKVATDLISEYIKRLDLQIRYNRLDRYYVIVDQTLTTPGEYGVTINTYIILANSVEDAKRICKEKYMLPDREFTIEDCKLVDDLHEGLMSSAEWYE